MNKRFQTRSILTGMVALAVVACGGGGGGGTLAGIDGTGAPAPTPAAAALSYGSITAFGSVYVNGVRYDTSSTEFSIDGVAGTQDDLSVGDVVLVIGSLDDQNPTLGTAGTIVFDDAVEGPVQSVDTAGGTLVVLGQTVRVGPATTFDDSFSLPSLAGITVGDIVEVSGLRGSDGSINATRIEPKPASLEFETTGIVSGLDSAAMTFSITGLGVDYSAAMLSNFVGGQIADGDLVEVKGNSLGTGGELLATRVERRGGLVTPDDGDHLEVEGFITRFVSASDFDVSGLSVTTTTSTVFEGGNAADLGLDIKVEVEGSVNASGVLVASKIDVRRSAAVRLLAHVDAVDAPNDTFVVLGITVRRDALTRIEDKSDQDLRPFGISDLAAGDYVEVRGVEFPAGSGEILAAQIEREDTDTATEVQGFVQSIAEPTFEILGVTVTTSGSTQFRDVADNAISSGQFYGQVAVGSLVKADGTEVADQAISAQQVEFENE